VLQTYGACSSLFYLYLSDAIYGFADFSWVRCVAILDIPVSVGATAHCLAVSHSLIGVSLKLSVLIWGCCEYFELSGLHYW
jgi:hypothetical protein